MSKKMHFLRPIIGIGLVVCLILSVPLGIAWSRQQKIKKNAEKHQQAGYYCYDLTYADVHNKLLLTVMVNDLPANKEAALAKIENIIKTGLCEEIVSSPEYKNHISVPIHLTILAPDKNHPFGWMPNGGEEDEIAEQKLKVMYVTIRIKPDKTYEIVQFDFFE